MLKMRKTEILFISLLLAVPMFFGAPAVAQDVKVDAAVLEKLQKTIEQQQRQLESMQQQLNQLKQTATDAQSQASEAKATADEAAGAAKHATEAVQPVAKTVSSGQPRVKLAISGQVNRAVNVIDDGKNTTAYFVDSDASNTRVRFIGTARATDDLTIGSRLEFAAASNESGDVNQNSEDSGDLFNVRWADLSLASKRFGKLYLGQGDTASNNAAEVDLSKTDVVAYSSISDMAAGMLFRQNRNDKLTTISVSDAFKNLDGLSRKSRVRYDTPTFWNFHLQGGLASK